MFGSDLSVSDFCYLWLFHFVPRLLRILILHSYLLFSMTCYKIVKFKTPLCYFVQVHYLSSHILWWKSMAHRCLYVMPLGCPGHVLRSTKLLEVLNTWFCHTKHPSVTTPLKGHITVWHKMTLECHLANRSTYKVCFVKYVVMELGIFSYRSGCLYNFRLKEKMYFLII